MGWGELCADQSARDTKISSLRQDVTTEHAMIIVTPAFYGRSDPYLNRLSAWMNRFSNAWAIFCHWICSRPTGIGKSMQNPHLMFWKYGVQQLKESDECSQVRARISPKVKNIYAFSRSSFSFLCRFGFDHEMCLGNKPLASLSTNAFAPLSSMP